MKANFLYLCDEWEDMWIVFNPYITISFLKFHWV